MLYVPFLIPRKTYRVSQKKTIGKGRGARKEGRGDAFHRIAKLTVLGYPQTLATGGTFLHTHTSYSVTG